MEPDYAGPRLSPENWVITEKWATEVTRYLEQGKRIHKRYVLELIAMADKVFKKLPNVVNVTMPKYGCVTVCGDLHGQFYDLLSIFKTNGYPCPCTNYVFNGDFVDRGSFSIEVIITLLVWKCAFPEWVHLIRGNHENKQVHKWHG